MTTIDGSAVADGGGQAPATGADRPTALAPGGENAVGVTLGLIGDEWTLLILRHAATGVRRYNDLLELLPISNSVLTSRLGRLAETGLLEKVAYQHRPPRYEYVLTKRGRDTWPILLAIWAWEQTWVTEHAERLPRMVHGRCGAEFVPVLVCGACQRPVEPREVEGRFGPSGSWERSVPAATTRRRSGQATGGQPGLFPQTMALVGNRWASAVLGAAFLGAHRFKEFEQRLGAPPTMIADRLRTFCELGVLRAVPSTERQDWLEYRLTAKGRAFFPVVMCAIDWGHRWFRAAEGRALIYRHLGCRRLFEPRLTCDHCHDLLRGDDVLLQPPPVNE
jgi:DNA-binding HxlR family transcriptional regulator